MPGEILLCRESEIPSEGRSRKFVAGGRDVLLFRLNGSIRAIESICPHVWTDFEQARLNARAGTIKCPNHGAVFDLTTGKPLCGPYGVDGDILPNLTFFDIILRNGDVLLISGIPAISD
ncbi:MAG: Rieske 2Fe-2S domain-containing protein [Thaumarchaeota archaeon]|nr:Rieske 2Fe-2S domain-containing protein [Nitrososphaerota archaeon]